MEAWIFTSKTFFSISPDLVPKISQLGRYLKFVNKDCQDASSFLFDPLLRHDMGSRRQTGLQSQRFSMTDYRLSRGVTRRNLASAFNPWASPGGWPTLWTRFARRVCCSRSTCPSHFRGGEVFIWSSQCLTCHSIYRATLPQSSTTRRNISVFRSFRCRDPPASDGVQSFFSAGRDQIHMREMYDRARQDSFCLLVQ